MLMRCQDTLFLMADVSRVDVSRVDVSRVDVSRVDKNNVFGTTRIPLTVKIKNLNFKFDPPSFTHTLVNMIVTRFVCSCDCLCIERIEWWKTSGDFYL